MINTRIRPAVPGDALQMVVLINKIIAIGGTTAQQTPMTSDRMRAHYLLLEGVVSVAVSTGRCNTGFKFLCWGMGHGADSLTALRVANVDALC